MGYQILNSHRYFRLISYGNIVLYKYDGGGDDDDDSDNGDNDNNNNNEDDDDDDGDDDDDDDAAAAAAAAAADDDDDDDDDDIDIDYIKALLFYKNVGKHMCATKDTGTFTVYPIYSGEPWKPHCWLHPFSVIFILHRYMLHTIPNFKHKLYINICSHHGWCDNDVIDKFHVDYVNMKGVIDLTIIPDALQALIQK